tara:strand:+ start:97 stop:1053 length:957 start_codon:yes stop_codon:yes gene_type:complete
MGWIRKKVKQIGRGIKKIGKKIGKAFKKVLKPFAKVFGKLGPIGSMAMMMIMPGIGELLAGWGSTMGNQVFGSIIKHVGNAVNFVATAPKKIFSTITNGLGATWDALTTAKEATGGTWFERFGEKFNESWTGRDMGSTWKWDVSEAGKTRLENIEKGEGNLLGYKAPVTETPSKTQTSTEPRSGVAGKIRDKTDSIKDIELKGIGTIGDAASVGSMALGLGQTAMQFSGTEDTGIGGVGDLSYQASNLLGPTTDAGGIYNITPPTWSYDFNKPYTQNQFDAQNIWNKFYNLPTGVDPSGMYGYGYGYDEWFSEGLGVR